MFKASEFLRTDASVLHDIDAVSCHILKDDLILSDSSSVRLFITESLFVIFKKSRYAKTGNPQMTFFQALTKSQIDVREDRRLTSVLWRDSDFQERDIYKLNRDITSENFLLNHLEPVWIKPYLDLVMFINKLGFVAIDLNPYTCFTFEERVVSPMDWDGIRPIFDPETRLPDKTYYGYFNKLVNAKIVKKGGTNVPKKKKGYFNFKVQLHDTLGRKCLNFEILKYIHATTVRERWLNIFINQFFCIASTVASLLTKTNAYGPATLRPQSCCQDQVKCSFPWIPANHYNLHQLLCGELVHQAYQKVRDFHKFDSFNALLFQSEIERICQSLYNV